MTDLYIRAIKLIHEAEGVTDTATYAFDVLPEVLGDFQKEIYQEYLDALLEDKGTKFEDKEDINAVQRTLTMLKIKRQVHKAVNEMLTQMFVMNGVDPKVVTITVRNFNLETCIQDELMMDIQSHQDSWELDNKMLQRTWHHLELSGPPLFELVNRESRQNKEELT
jgi:hypothetical protein